MSGSEILLVEDDAAMAEMVSQVLGTEGFKVTWAKDGKDGFAKIRQALPRLILLDLTLPEIDGHDVCRNLRAAEATRRLPIVILTGRVEESELIKGLANGADDYIVKPFRPKELIARIHALLRRSELTSPLSAVAKFGPLEMDAEKFEVRAGQEMLSLTRAEFRLLWTLLATPGKVFSREELLTKIAGAEANVVDRNVDVHIGSIRKKLGKYGDVILTVRGIGYKISTDLGD